jgi:hypothetical protein
MKKFKVILMIVLAVIMVTSAFAVTYQNNSSSNVILRNKQGNSVVLAPGKTIETYYYSSDTNLTKTADTPFWNRVIGRETITATAGGVDASIDPDTDIVMIFQISSTISVYIQSDTNTPPALLDWTIVNPIIQIPVRGRCDNLVIKGSGTCEVVQYRDEN